MIEASIRLRRAIHMHDVPLVRRIIKANPHLLANPDFDDKSNTNLHLAASVGHVDIATILVDAGHDTDEISRNADADTPLMLAVQRGHVELAKLLIRRCERCIPWTNKLGLDALAMACQHPLSTPLIPILLEHPDFPASPHQRDKSGNTPLHHASASGSLKALRMLLSAGADPLATNTHDWMPLAYSQTVAAEVYFKNLVADFERKRVELLHEENTKKAEDMRRKGAGVRLITDDLDQLSSEQHPENHMPTLHTPIERRKVVPGAPAMPRSPGRTTGLDVPRTRPGSSG